MSYRDKITQSVLLFCPVLKMSIFTWVWDYSTNTLTQPILSHNQQNGFYASNSFLTNILHFQYIKSMKTFQRLECCFQFLFFLWGGVVECLKCLSKYRQNQIQKYTMGTCFTRKSAKARGTLWCGLDLHMEEFRK